MEHGLIPFKKYHKFSEPLAYLYTIVLLFFSFSYEVISEKILTIYPKFGLEVDGRL